jgi:hypothetical protein
MQRRKLESSLPRKLERFNKNIPKSTNFFTDLSNAVLTALNLPPIYPDSAIPISGYFVGPNYSANRLLRSGEKLTQADLLHPAYDEFDEIAKYHDIAYNLALSFPDPEPFLKKADEIFVQKTQQLEINKTALLFDAVSLVLSAYGLYQTAQAFKQASQSAISSIQELWTSQVREGLIYQNRLDIAEARIRANFNRLPPNLNATERRRFTEILNREIYQSTSQIDSVFGRTRVPNPYYQPLPDFPLNRPSARNALVPAIPANIFELAPNESFDIYYPTRGPNLQQFELDNFRIAQPIIQALSQSLATTEILSIIFGAVGIASSSAAIFDLLERFTVWMSEKIFTNIIGNHELRPQFTKLNLTPDDVSMYLDSLYNSNNPLDLEFIELYKSAFAQPDPITQPAQEPTEGKDVIEKIPLSLLSDTKDFTTDELLAIYQLYF